VTVREWLPEFRPYAPGYQPRCGKRKVSTQPFHKPNTLPPLELIQGEKAQVESKKDLAAMKWKCRSVSAVQGFPLIPRRFNPYLSKERRQVLHTHLTQIADEYAQMELEQIRLLKAGALPEGFDCQRIAFLSSIEKYYEALVKDEEDLFEDLYEEC
jgi:hypothetical protein